jgi:hypothetical protein
MLLPSLTNVDTKNITTMAAKMMAKTTERRRRRAKSSGEKATGVEGFSIRTTLGKRGD